MYISDIPLHLTYTYAFIYIRMHAYIMYIIIFMTSDGAITMCIRCTVRHVTVVLLSQEDPAGPTALWLPQQLFLIVPAVGHIY